MHPNRNINLTRLLLFCKEHSNVISSNSEIAKVYLKEQGKNPDSFAAELLKKIKKKQLEVNASKNSFEFGNLQALRDKAIKRAKELIASPGFSFMDFMRKEQFALHNKNLENLNNEEIQNILEDYLFLKMQDNNSNQGDI